MMISPSFDSDVKTAYLNSPLIVMYITP